eukprot:CAMPEP_0177233688 /NCGR_PEP_ID=MMETSP0367-20130122/43999_1 /TAXON_ID=447022 ORGANISM="Scrippsiella hangoei-like, Strain SHHI-4" /NCGR_SAMPLE_ID=MMETSP0367 /ASSEMBLY_ACC=CAM_ASM_000362 /LENGTH=396 /DNA_ID=CAMNT_0018684437 /DNA_START=54 /DNA_END=1244 /DNA_ORIENTATION=-
MAKDGMGVLVCGGAVLDCIVKPFDEAQRGASRTSLPGSAKVSLGGVARNMAESIARLGGISALLSAIGQDEAGDQLLAAAGKLGINVEHVVQVPGGRTATFTALLDGGGDLVGAVADMAVFDRVSPASIDRAVASGALRGKALVVCDANLSAATLERVLSSGSDAGVPTWFEPVSVAKAPRGRILHGGQPWQLISPNWDELQAMLGSDLPKPFASEAAEGRLPDAVLRAVDEALTARLAEHMLLTMGPRGVLLASASAMPPGSTSSGSAPIGLLGSGTRRRLALDASELLRGAPGAPPAGVVPPLEVEVESLSVTGGRRLWYRLLRPLASVRDTTGAGDALLAGTARAFAHGWPLEEAVLLGLLCAHLTLFVDGAVAPFLMPDLLRRLEVQARSRL